MRNILVSAASSSLSFERSKRHAIPSKEELSNIFGLSFKNWSEVTSSECVSLNVFIKLNCLRSLFTWRRNKFSAYQKWISGSLPPAKICCTCEMLKNSCLECPIHILLNHSNNLPLHWPIKGLFDFKSQTLTVPSLEHV